MDNSGYYSEHHKFYVAVDCIIFGFDQDGLKLLLIKRNFEPMKGKWSLMGGFLQENESLDEAAARVLYQLTGLREVYLEQLYTYGEVERDPGERVISVSYYALIRTEDYNSDLGKRHGARWFLLDKKPPLILDHDVMVDKALRRLRRKTRSQPIGFELLPEKFTIPMLQRLYEGIHGKKFDKRNFRKKIFQLNILKKLDEKEKSGSRKGAWLYKFDKKKYNKLEEAGMHFSI